MMIIKFNIRYIFFIGIFLNVLTVFAQNDTCTNNDVKCIFQNNKLEYSIVLSSCDTCVPISNVGYRVIVKLTKEERVIIDSINNICWLRMLQDTTTDWAANIILYSLYNKDAVIFNRHSKENYWRKHYKDNDTKYWRDFLK